jgi:hypothetical protein
LCACDYTARFAFPKITVARAKEEKVEEEIVGVLGVFSDDNDDGDNDHSSDFSDDDDKGEIAKTARRLAGRGQTTKKRDGQSSFFNSGWSSSSEEEEDEDYRSLQRSDSLHLLSSPPPRLSITSVRVGPSGIQLRQKGSRLRIRHRQHSTGTGHQQQPSVEVDVGHSKEKAAWALEKAFSAALPHLDLAAVFGGDLA